MARSRSMLPALILLGTAGAGCGLEFIGDSPGSSSGVAPASGTTGTGGAGTTNAGGIGGVSGGTPGPGGGGVAGSAGGMGGACYGCAEAYERTTYVPVAQVCGSDKTAYGGLQTCICNVGQCATSCTTFCNQSSGADESCLTCVDGADACDGEGTACGVDVFSQ